MLHFERSSVSRVREICTHVLKGGLAAIRSSEECQVYQWHPIPT